VNMIQLSTIFDCLSLFMITLLQDNARPVNDSTL